MYQKEIDLFLKNRDLQNISRFFSKRFGLTVGTAATHLLVRAEDEELILTLLRGFFIAEDPDTRQVTAWNSYVCNPFSSETGEELVEIKCDMVTLSRLCFFINQIFIERLIKTVDFDLADYFGEICATYHLNPRKFDDGYRVAAYETFKKMSEDASNV